MPDRTPLWKDTTTDLNTAWREAVRFYQIGDTRAGYLRTLELCLSLCLPGQMIWGTETYSLLPALPENPRAKVAPGAYFNHLMACEAIMREVGLVDKEPLDVEPDEIDFLDMEREMPSEKLDEYFAGVFKPGAAILTTGFKGGGKSHTAIAVAEQLVKGVYPSVGNVRVYTNILFYHKVRGRIVEECPPGVRSVTTMRELFPLLAEAMREDPDVLNLLILDEAQGFLSGDSNGTNASKMMKEFLGIIRKFRLAVWLLTPSAMAVGPAFRNYLNDPRYPGNLTCKFKKDLGWNARYIARHNLDCEPRELMAVKNYDSKPVILRVPVTEWTQTRHTLKEGEYCYDHEASATFYMGDDWDWDEFSRQIGGVSSMRILDTIDRYYATSCAGPKAPETPREIRRSVQDDVIMRMIEAGRSQREVAEALGVSHTTVQRRLATSGYVVPGTPEDHENENVPLEGMASMSGTRHIGGAFSPAIYISNKPPAYAGVPRGDVAAEDGPEEASGGVIDGPPKPVRAAAPIVGTGGIA